MPCTPSGETVLDGDRRRRGAVAGHEVVRAGLLKANVLFRVLRRCSLSVTVTKSVRRIPPASMSPIVHVVPSKVHLHVVPPHSRAEAGRSRRRTCASRRDTKVPAEKASTLRSNLSGPMLPASIRCATCLRAQV